MTELRHQVVMNLIHIAEFENLTLERPSEARSACHLPETVEVAIV
jgi:hypothetical protein